MAEVEWISGEELARRLDVAPKAVRVARDESNRITAAYDVHRKKYDAARAIALYNSTRVPANNRYGQLPGDDASLEFDMGIPAKEPSKKPDAKPDDGDWAQRFIRAKALSTEEDHAIKLLNRLELLGELHRAEDVEVIMGDMIVRTRQGALSIPGKMADRLASEKDPAKVQSILEDALQETLANLSGYDPVSFAAARRQRMANKRA